MEAKGMPSRHAMPVPAKPNSFDTDRDAQIAWKRQAADIYRANQKAQAKQILTRPPGVGCGVGRGWVAGCELSPGGRGGKARRLSIDTPLRFLQ
jgi:hypothetical protein